MNAVMSGEFDRTDEVGRAERLQLTWALAWPCIALSLVYCWLRSQMRLNESQLQGVDQVVGLLEFFLFTTWVVRRTVRLDFPGFHLRVIRRDAAAATRGMTYRESLSVAWLISWRTSLILSPVLVAVWVFQQQRPELYSLSVWLWSSAAELLVFYFWIVRMALNKSYERFSAHAG
jgi:hypothetical protein